MSNDISLLSCAVALWFSEHYCDVTRMSLLLSSKGNALPIETGLLFLTPLCANVPQFLFPPTHREQDDEAFKPADDTYQSVSWEDTWKVSSIQNDGPCRFRSTDTPVGPVQRRRTWPLPKDDKMVSWKFFFFFFRRRKGVWESRKRQEKPAAEMWPSATLSLLYKVRLGHFCHLLEGRARWGVPRTLC